MKKITLSVGLLAAIMSVKAQDTTCTYFTGKKVLEFDYKMDTILYVQEHKTKFFDIIVEYDNTPICFTGLYSDPTTKFCIMEWTVIDKNISHIKSLIIIDQSFWHVF